MTLTQVSTGNEQIEQLSSTVFEREYLDNEKFGIDQLAQLLNYTENSMKQTMPLVNLYTARSIDKANE
jgi:hypothetical protein